MRNFLSFILLIFFFNIFSADREAAALNLNLQKGWNLVSVHVDSDEPVENYMAGRLYVGGYLVSDVSSVIRRIWSYEETWFSYPSSSSNVLTHFKPGQGYWFYVAEAATINIGDTIQYTPNMSAPSNFNAVGGDGQITINWTPVTGATEYRIYRKSSSGVSDSDTREIVAGGDTSSHTITNLENGTAYYFKIEAWNTLGAGALSGEVSATPQASSGGGATQTVQGIDLVRIPAGTFMMGSPDEEGFSTERPQHQVTISNDFYMGKYEVTQKQWEAVMGGTDPWPGTNPSSSYGVGADYPAYYVSWTDITGVDGFLDKLNQAAGCNVFVLPTDTTRYHPANVPAGCFRLPTEAEWEYSARAGTTTKYYWGDGDTLADIGPYAWYLDNSYTLGSSHPNYGTNPVGSKLHNAWGLYDMSGNVWEWTYDWYTSYSSESVTDPTGPISGSDRVYRGGGWYHYASFLRSANRYGPPPSYRDYGVGFRLVFEVTQYNPNMPAPSNFNAFGGSGQITLSWTPVTGATEYRIYHKSSSGVSDSDTREIVAGGDTSSHTITNLENGTAYYFRVEAWNIAGASHLSDEVSATPQPAGSGGDEQTVEGIDLVRISAGTFMMGSPDGDGDGDDWGEKPQHQVTISNDFYMGKYEVTQKQWLDVMGAWPVAPSPSSSYGVGDNHPAYYVSWTEITKVDGFLDKLNQATSGCNISGLPTDTTRYHPTNVPEGCFRLPTEAEWEYAARAGTTSKYYWGDGEGLADIDPYAWYIDNSYNLDSSHPDYGNQPVGLKLPNAWGLYDMSGNVYEWVYDWSGSYTSGAETDPTGPASASNRVLRGGSWYFEADYLRSAYHISYSPWNRDFFLGFRLVLAVRQPDALSSAPNGVGAVGGDGQVTASWNEVSDATEYRVYYKESSGVTISDPFEIITGGENTSYTFTNLTNGTAYYFRVEAWNIAGASHLSDEVSATPQPAGSGGDEQTVEGIDLVRISAGTFMMGSPDGVGYSDEKPQHQVTISNDFYMGKYEVTQKQWLDVMGTWPGDAPSSYYGEGENHPAYYVSWTDITKVDGFLDKLNQATPRCNISELPTDTTRYHPANVPEGCFRLPTEAEWEYAARAGTTTKYYWGDGDTLTDIDPYAWYVGNITTNGESYGTKVVGRKLPNAWGLYDMSGNVYEWNYDWDGSYTSGAETDPTGTASASRRVARGGGWYDAARDDQRSAYRYSHSPELWYNNLGFRLVLVVRQL